MFELAPLSAVPADAVERLLDAAFGADRHGRTAYRVRDGVDAEAGLCFAAVAGDALVGSIQCWPVALHGDDGSETPMVMVGPVAVSPAHQNIGIGRALMWRAIRRAGGEEGVTRIDGGEALMLIGDPDYYDQFGFDASHTTDWRLPGPFERHRLLARGVVPDVAGLVGPRRPFAQRSKSA
ncbi:N-acetyltransferase [Sphingomonas suaedae]|uniref:N-acetyltransferase n=1 Tax=Sphingomonas suaedae TaxID=2599297 RepID=A0A518RLE0_9SPHN|nr:N-acetyltransferase [Sphingomonas suaedae]QDX28240.1 N-acetyltransferase [Sphingomonas suaedae]